MTIKSNGGIFGRNPTFNNVTVDGLLTVDQIVEKTAAAGITLDGVTLKDGNVVLANGKGIDFSATPNTGTSELLSDYEEGTWSPNVGGDATYYVQEGFYVKVGKLVHVWGKLVVNVLGTGSTTLVSGLPYTSASSIYATPPGTITVNYYNSLAVNVLTLHGLVDLVQTTFRFSASTSAGVTTTTVPAAIFGNTARIDFSGCYQSF